ncbi:MAG: Stp1/IreP family PP2C-type Ser/Thr phosphatase [Oscillospiraceae bacterium]|jgi:protein phosphatase|nr:Stp1/IreP family PP2C-type Ser/Thr phosphatase [Oscillospiraceae bacterium]
MRFFSKTDIGRKRTENQDRVWIGALGESGGAVAVVLCDGMGGENAGSRASQLTVDFISERIRNGFRDDVNRNTIRNLMITSVVAANSLVYDESLIDEKKHGMGTTCVAAVAHGEMAYIINVGDSRAYHIFEDGIQQVTKDHTYIRSLIEEGRITEEESRSHPDRNAITRAIGAEPEITPDYFELDLRKDSILLFCSDGLHSYGDDAKIAEIIVNNPKNKVCGLLVDYALRNGGRDNITAAIIVC